MREDAAVSHYHLLVYYGEAIVPTETFECDLSDQVLNAIPRLLAKHPGCARITVMSGATTLYSVDKNGDAIR
jgi:hypothetical protein